MARVTLALTLVVSLAAPASADVVFDTFGPGDSFNGTTSVSVSATQWIAAKFSPSADVTLTSIEFAIRNISGAANVFVELRADTASKPGAILDSANPTGWSDGIVDASMAGGVALDSTLSYWVTLTDPTNNQSWFFSSPAVAGTRALSTNSGSSWFTFSTTLTAFRVNGDPDTPNPVPEPSSLALVALGLLGAMALRRRR